MMNIVSMEDIEFLSKQTPTKINTVLAGMFALMNDINCKVTTLESQSWFQRMIKTVTGKNRWTQIEIQKNHDKLNCYMAEAVAELYKRNCISNEVILSLGTQINEVYADNFQIRKIIKDFVEKLNAKIDSVDNFHLLNEEITQGKYTLDSHLVAICKVMSQLDYRILDDDRKLDILRKNLIEQEILNDEPISLKDYLNYVIRIPNEDVGQIYLELGTIKTNIIARLILKIMENYHFLPDMEKKLKDSTILIEDVTKGEGLNNNVDVSIIEIYDNFIKTKVETKNSLALIHDDGLESSSPDEVIHKGTEDDEETKQTKLRQRSLTKDEIIKITKKYGYNVKLKLATKADTAYGIQEGTKIYTEYTWPGLTLMGLCFCEDGIHSWVGYISTNHRLLSYDDLRNKKSITMKWLHRNYKVFPDEVVMVLMELKELE